jgi:hypothetical protein
MPVITNLTTIVRSALAFAFLLMVGFGAPLMKLPESLLAWTLAAGMALVDLWCLRRMRAATPGGRALLSEIMVLSAAGAILLVSATLSMAQRQPQIGDFAMIAIVVYLALRLRVVLRHLRNGTEPAPRRSGIQDAKRMISETKARMDRATTEDR